jgi:hypothetical protein
VPRVISRLEAKEKKLSFYFVKPCKFGHKSGRYVSDKTCIECRKNKSKQKYYKLDKDDRKKEARKQYLKHRDKRLAYSKVYRKKNKIKNYETIKKWRKKNPEKVKTIMKEYRKRNYAKVREREKKYKLENREKLLEKAKIRYHSDPLINKKNLERKRNDPLSQQKQKARRLKNLEKYRKREKEYVMLKRKTDINFRISHSLRSRFNSALKRKNKTDRKKWTSVINLLGCSIDDFKLKLSKKFKKGMNWNNYGEWHIDHINAVANYDLTKKENQIKAFHYSNLQPLWAEENFKKNKY